MAKRPPTKITLQIAESYIMDSFKLYDSDAAIFGHDVNMFGSEIGMKFPPEFRKVFLAFRLWMPI